MSARRLLVISLWLVLLAAAAVFAARFPWRELPGAFADANWALLAAATVINVLSMAAKGWAWHLLLKPVAPHRFRSAQAATFVGAAVNCLTVSVGGEAARVHVLAQRDGVRYRDAAAGVLASRVAEAVALALFIVVMASVLPSGSWATALRIAAWGGLALAAVFWQLARTGRLAGMVPGWLARLLGPAWGSIHPRVMVAPVALGLFNWFTQWATFHLAILSVGVPVSAAASLTALLASNVGGIPRLTPGNLGVLQASVILALTAHGDAVAPALAAGLVLQAIQTLPMVAIGLAVAGRDVVQILRAPGAVPGDA